MIPEFLVAFQLAWLPANAMEEICQCLDLTFVHCEVEPGQCNGKYANVETNKRLCIVLSELEPGQCNGKFANVETTE